jgi:CRP-like cAMP-binding protein
MQLLNRFNRVEILNYAHTLEVGDSLIIHNNNNLNIYLLIAGALVLTKVFTNQEIISLSILSTHDLINVSFEGISHSNYFYKAEALAETYILSLDAEGFQMYQNILSFQYYTTSIKYTYMLEILAHRNSRDRLVHLLLVLGESFGIINKDSVEIKLNTSKSMLASIIGSNRNTISKLLDQLVADRLINYSKQKIIIHNSIYLVNNRNNNL